MAKHEQMTIIEINNNSIQQTKTIFVNIIFNNFIELTKYSYVKHTRNDIYALLSSEQMFGYIIKYSEKIIAYLIGEVSTMPDGRNAYYLSYIYVIPKYQHLKIGTLLMKRIIEHCRHFGIPFIVLTCDMQNIKLVSFYKKFGFIIDPVLSGNKEHDILCLYL